MRLAAALVLALTVVGASAHAQAPDRPAPSGGTLLQPTPEEQLIGAVDLCVRWGPADPAHLSDVVMTNSSGDAALDETVPGMVRDIPFPRPQDDNGAWFPLNLSFGAAEPHKTAPDCDRLLRAADDKN